MKPLWVIRLLPLLLLIFSSSCESGTQRRARADQNARLEQQRSELQSGQAELRSSQAELAESTRRLEQRQETLSVLEQQTAERAAQLDAELERVSRLRHALSGQLMRGPVPAVEAGRAIVVDAASGEVLFEHNADQTGPIASTQKLLTALIVAEQGNLDQLVTVEPPDVDCAPTRIGHKVGEHYTRRQLLTALLVRSANDIAQCLARDVAGSNAAFARRMNEKARELGLLDSHFTNPHGLPDDAQHSTARDLARIALAVDQNPELRQIVRLKTYDFLREGQETIPLTNTNRVLREFEFCDGMKTGFTNAAGHCLVASGEREGQRRIAIVLNDGRGVWRDARALLEWSFRG